MPRRTEDRLFREVGRNGVVRLMSVYSWHLYTRIVDAERRMDAVGYLSRGRGAPINMQEQRREFPRTTAVLKTAVASEATGGCAELALGAGIYPE